MPRVKLIGDDGWVALDERVTHADLQDEHLRRQLAERLRWAAADAEVHARTARQWAGPERRWGRRDRRGRITRPLVADPSG